MVTERERETEERDLAGPELQIEFLTCFGFLSCVYIVIYYRL